MLSSYPVACPHAGCSWTGSSIPSLAQGGAHAEVAPMQRAWFRCPCWQGDWAVRITEDGVTVLPAVEHGG
jgi:Rieske Fe-S protein